MLGETLTRSGVLLVELAPRELDMAADIFDQLDETERLPAINARFDGQERQQVLAAFEHAGVPAGALDQNETWAAALMLASAARQSDPGNGVDRALMSDKAEIVALESARSQLGLFDALPDAEQNDLLVAVAQGVLADQSETSIETWLTGDLASLELLANGSILADPQLRTALHTNRNLAWLPVISDNIRAGDRPLVAVGAAHMLGLDGLPALLEAEGFTVTRIQ